MKEGQVYCALNMNPIFIIDQRYSMAKISVLIFFSIIISSFSPSYGYDSLDPFGNITVTWDFITDNGDTADVRVTIYNNQLFRHVEAPGWQLSWAWKGDEVVWAMWGAEATEQGNCTRFKGQQKPHCCDKVPVIIDLMPGAPYNRQYLNCCRGGVLTSMTQDMATHSAAFKMNYNKATAYLPDGNVSVPVADGNFSMPENFKLGVPGYSCSLPFQVPPTKFTNDGKRWEQMLATWNVTCIYSQFLESPAPKCCVSLSAFYNDTVVPCPICSCNCKGLPGAHCVDPGKASSVLQPPQGNNGAEPTSPVVMCSRHMCPIRVHWHIKQSYKGYWRVKITVTNLNLVKNYSEWNLVMLHPNLQSVMQVFSFNYMPLPIYGNINDTGMFWGLKYYNDMLMSYGENGNVQTEMLLRKDSHFTFREGWAFPRKVSFNGEECVMPIPDDYPRLPNTAHVVKTSPYIVLVFSLLVLLLSILF